MASHGHPVHITDDHLTAARDAWLGAMADGEPASDVARLFGEHEALRGLESRQMFGGLLTLLRGA